MDTSSNWPWGICSRTQRASGVADDQLRPALGQLAAATGNLYDAQNLLNLALDVSAGTGRDLTSVTAALSKAANGQTTSLRRLAPSIDGAVLKTGDLTAITGELTRLFGGQAEARANTFAGTIDRLTIAADELMEAFGKGFLDAFQEGLGGSTEDLMKTLQDLEPQMEQIGGTIGKLAGTIGKMSGAIDLFGNLDLEKSKVQDIDRALNGYVDGLLRAAKAQAAFEQINARLKRLEGILMKVAGVMIFSMAGVIWASLLRH